MTDEELDRINRAEEIQLYTENRCEALEKENRLAKSLLYCTKGTCDNCGFVNCENFQRQRKSEPCALYISYQDRIKQLEKENAELKAKIAHLTKHLEPQSMSALFEQVEEEVKLEQRIKELEAYNEKLLDGDIEKHNKIVELQAQIEKMKCCEMCRHHKWGSCNYHPLWENDCKENGLKLFELKEIKEK